MRALSIAFWAILALSLSHIPITIGQACVPSYFAVLFGNEAGNPTSAATSAGYNNNWGVLVPNGIANVTLSSSPSYGNSSASAPAGQYGLFLIYVGTAYPFTTYNVNGFSNTLTSSPNIYITGSSGTVPTYPYNFTGAARTETFAYPTIFGNGNNTPNSYLITFGFVVSGTSCTNTTYYIALFNPSTISYATYPTAPGVNGDPQFSGLRGQSYQVHGIDGAVYNIISDVDVQVNSRFVFLSGPRVCPLMPSTGKKSSACFAHDGSYLGEIGVKNRQGDKLFIASGPASTGFASITLNTEALKVGYTSDFINITSTHEVSIYVGSFLIKLENSDGFVNLASVQSLSTKLQSHGLLGQTWRNRRYSGTVKEIEGEVDDYLIDEDCVFGNSFMFNKFNL